MFCNCILQVYLVYTERQDCFGFTHFLSFWLVKLVKLTHLTHCGTQYIWELIQLHSFPDKPKTHNIESTWPCFFLCVRCIQTSRSEAIRAGRCSKLQLKCHKEEVVAIFMKEKKFDVNQIIIDHQYSIAITLRPFRSICDYLEKEFIASAMMPLAISLIHFPGRHNYYRLLDSIHKYSNPKCGNTCPIIVYHNH